MEREAGGRGCPGLGREVSIHRGVTAEAPCRAGCGDRVEPQPGEGT